MGVAQALGNPSASTAVVNHQLKSEAYKSYLQGRSVVRREKPAEGIQAAISFYNRAVALDPNWGCAYVALAEASLQMNQVIHDTIWLDRSLDAAARSLRNDITCPSSEFRLARLLNKTGNNIPALSLFQHLSGRFSYSDQIQREIANTYLKLGLYNDAVAESIHAVTIDPNQWRNRDIAAKAYLAAGNYLKAIEHFKEVTSLNADSPTRYHNLGAAYLYAGWYDLAVEPLRKALVLNPRAATHSNLGTAYFYSGRVLASVHEYEKAVALSPDSDVYIGNLATAYRLTGRRRRANDLFVKAIRLARKSVSEYMSQGFPRALIEANPNLQALQHDRRFIEVFKKYAVSN